MMNVVLIVAPKDCPKCRDCRAICEELAAAYPGQVQTRYLTTEAPEAAQYGVVLPPTMVVDDFIVAVGSVPRKEAVLELVAQKLSESQPASELAGVYAAEFDESLGCEPMMLFWYVDEGATVEAGQDLCEIESAKAVFVIQAPASGVLERIHCREGDAVQSGHLLAEIRPSRE